VVRRYQNVLRCSAPTHNRVSTVRGAQNGPCAGTVYSDVHLPVAVVVRCYRHVLGCSAPSHNRVSSVRGAQKRPRAAAINPNVALAVRIEVHRSKADAFDGADVTSGNAVMIAVDVASKASLVCLQRRSCTVPAAARITCVDGWTAGNQTL